MDIYFSTLADNFKQAIPVEDFESFIWTNRYNAYGDFELIMEEEDFLSKGLTGFFYVLQSETRRVMMVETIEVKKNSEEKRLVTISGRSIEAFLQFRTFESHDGDEITITGSPGYAAAYIVNRYVVDPVTAGGNALSMHIDPVPVGPSATRYIKRENVYLAVKRICDEFDYGFSITTTLADTGPHLHFTIYSARDHSDPYRSFYKIYSEDSGSLFDVSYLSTTKNFRNHARVIGARTTAEVFAPGYSASTTGFNRRTLVVDASDIGRNGAGTASDDIPKLQARGREELAKLENRNITAVDGDLPFSEHFHERWGLGYIVSVRDIYGNTNKMRISEEIWTADADGERHYPTFTDLE